MLFRPRRGLIATRVSMMVLLLLCCLGWFSHPGGKPFASIWAWYVPALTLLLCLPLYVLGRPLAVASEQGLFVRNLIRSRRLTWPEIVHVRFARDAAWVSLDLSDGTVLSVMAIAASDGPRARSAARTLATFAERGFH